MNKSPPDSDDDQLSSSLARLAIDRADEAAWRLIYTHLWPFVMTVTYRRLKNRSLAEDGAQEVFIKLLRSCPFEKLNNIDELHAYVWRTALNVSTTIHWSKQRTEQGERDLSESMDGEASVGSEGEDRLRFDDLFVLANEVLGPVDRRFVALLACGSNVADAARELGVTYSAAAVRLHRLKQKVFKALKNNDK